MHRYDHFHTHTQTSSLLSLCAAITAYVRLCSYLPFCADNSTTFAQHADSKMEFQSRFLIKPNLLSDVSPPSIHSIVPMPSTLYATLGPPPPSPPPWLMCHPTSIFSLRHKHKWSPRAKWHRALTGITAANRFNYIAVAVSRSSTQSSGGWDDVDPNLPVTQMLEGQGLSPASSLKCHRRSRRKILVKAILCLVLVNLLIENRRSLGRSSQQKSRCFLMLFHVK